MARTHLSWATPDACTLPSAEQPLRAAEFDHLFAHDVTSIRREGRCRVVLGLADRPGLVAAVGDLTTRETDCCSFFTFTLAATKRAWELTVTVPEAYADVLAAFAERADELSTAATGAPTDAAAGHA